VGDATRCGYAAEYPLVRGERVTYDKPNRNISSVYQIYMLHIPISKSLPTFIFQIGSLLIYDLQFEI